MPRSMQSPAGRLERSVETHAAGAFATVGFPVFGLRVMGTLPMLSDPLEEHRFISSFEGAAAAPGNGPAEFATTRWTVVLRVAQGESKEAAAALAGLCQAYWFPLYVYVRRQGRSHEDAEDLVQGFFERVLEKGYFEDADRSKGRFRTFLLTALKRYMTNEWHRAHRVKRGGGQEILSLDGEDIQARYGLEPADKQAPDLAFERRWAITLLARVLDLLEAEYAAAGRREVFDAIRGFLSGEGEGGCSEEVGRRLGISAGNLRITIHRLRQRYREVLRREISRTVDDPDSVDDELRHLFAALGG